MNYDDDDNDDNCVVNLSLLDRWVTFKRRVKWAAINYGKRKKWLEKFEEKELVEKMNNILSNRASAVELAGLGAAKARRAEDFLHGEKYSAYFLGLEKQTQEKQMINVLVNPMAGKETRDRDEIEMVAVNFYTDLFEADRIDQQAGAELLMGVSDRLSLEDSSLPEEPVSVDEVIRAITGLSQCKSPGEDGLTSEFYIQFKESIAPTLCNVFNEMVKTGAGWSPSYTKRERMTSETTDQSVF